MEAKSPTVFVSNPVKATMAKTTKIAAKPPGMALVRRGKKAMIAIESATSAPKIINDSPPSHPPSLVLNCSIWLPPMMMASPLTNPKITGCGTKRINFPKRSRPAPICNIPAKMTVAKMYSGPS